LLSEWSGLVVQELKDATKNKTSAAWDNMPRACIMKFLTKPKSDLLVSEIGIVRSSAASSW
jgi:hypothetical protein